MCVCVCVCVCVVCVCERMCVWGGGGYTIYTECADLPVSVLEGVVQEVMSSI